MLYKARKFKVIHWDGIENLSNDDTFLLETELGTDVYDAKGNILPIVVNWRTRVYDNKVHKFSYIVNARYLLHFNDYNEYPLNDIIEMFDHSHYKMSEDWSERIIGTKIEGNQFPPTTILSKTNKALQIIELAQQANILSR